MSDDPAEGPPPYREPPYGSGYPVAPTTNGFAIAALVCAFLCWPLGLVFGFMARNQIRRTGEQGDGLALAGIIISTLSAVITVVWIVVIASVASRS